MMNLPSHPEVYDSIGDDYRDMRVPDRRIQACFDKALGDAYLDTKVRAAISTLAQLPESVVAWGIAQLKQDLQSGDWFRRHGALMQQDSLDLGYRLIVAE